MTIHRIAGTEFDAAGPAAEVRELAFGLLSEEVVGDAHGQLAVAMQALDHLVIVGIALGASAGVDHARDAEAVELAHEVPRRIELMRERKLGPLAQSRIEDRRVGLRNEHSG